MPNLVRYTIIIIGVIALGIVLWRSPPEPFTELFDPEELKRPSYPATYMIKPYTRQFDQSGELEYEMRADSIIQYEPALPNYSSLITKPDLIFYDSQSPRWKVIANLATVKEQQDEFLLSGDVIISSNETDRTIELNTEEILLKPGEQYAETDKPVIISENNGTLKTTGMKVFLNQQRIELLSNVSSTYSVN